MSAVPEVVLYHKPKDKHAGSFLHMFNLNHFLKTYFAVQIQFCDKSFTNILAIKIPDQAYLFFAWYIVYSGSDQS